jgi:hypothetical protein
MQRPICNSDHTGIKLTIKTGKLKQPIHQQRLQRQKLARHDRTELETDEGRKAFNDICSASIAETITSGDTRIEVIDTACAKAAATPPLKTKDPNANSGSSCTAKS